MPTLTESPEELQHLMEAVDRGDTAPVIDTCRRYVQENEIDPLAWYLLGVVAHGDRSYDEARRAYSSSIFSVVYRVLRDHQDVKVRPRPHPKRTGESLWKTVYLQAALRITTEDGFGDLGLASEYIDDDDAPERGLFWLDIVNATEKHRLWLIDAPSGLYWLLRQQGLYANCIRNLSHVVGELGEQALADAYRQEADEFDQPLTSDS